jgi:hypothetical protein
VLAIQPAPRLCFYNLDAAPTATAWGVPVLSLSVFGVHDQGDVMSSRTVLSEAAVMGTFVTKISYRQGLPVSSKLLSATAIGAGLTHSLGVRQEINAQFGG